MLAFASIDPYKGKFSALDARRLIEEHGVRGFHGMALAMHARTNAGKSRFSSWSQRADFIQAL